MKKSAGSVAIVISSVATLGAGLAVLVLNGYAQQPPSVSQAEKVDYNWQIRPVLSDNCYRCHGPDAKSRQAGLRLDQQESAYEQAIVPGKPQESEMIRRISSKDPAYRMPPPAASAKPLTDAEVATLTEWVKQGAEYKPHWAFITPVKAALPQTSLNQRVVNAIDRFIFARLEKEGLKPSPEADKETLINRVTLSLTWISASDASGVVGSGRISRG